LETRESSKPLLKSTWENQISDYMEREYRIKTKEDLGNLSARTKILKVDCDLNKDDAIGIMQKCRTLEEVIFGRKAFIATDDDAKEYLGKWVFVEME